MHTLYRSQMKSTDGHGQMRKGFATGRLKKALTQLTVQNQGLPIPICCGANSILYLMQYNICHHITNKNQVKVPCVGQNVCHKVVEGTYSGAYATRWDSGVELLTLMLRTCSVGAGAVPSF